MIIICDTSCVLLMCHEQSAGVNYCDQSPSIVRNPFVRPSARKFRVYELTNGTHRQYREQRTSLSIYKR